MTQTNHFERTKLSVLQFLQLVADAKDRLPALAEELQANNFQCTWSIEDDAQGDIEYACRIQCTFGQYGTYHAGSYITATRPFEVAEADIRQMHSKWKQDKQRVDKRRQEEDIKQRLYEEYLAKNSGY